MNIGKCVLVFGIFSPALVVAQDDPDKPVWQMSLEEIRQITDLSGTGRDLSPPIWPGNARAAILFSLDVDNEPGILAPGERDRARLSVREFGARRGIGRIVKILDENEIPATFFTPVLSLLLAPEMIDIISKSGLHEYAVHGWAHESAANLPLDEQRQMLKNSVDRIEQLTGQKPVGFRAPGSSMTDITLPTMKELGFIYDSTFMADDQPYELIVNGSPSGLVELPPDFNLSDVALTIAPHRGLYTPREVLQQAKDAFDATYKEGGMMVFVVHPHVSGRTSRIIFVEELIGYMKQYDDVWFATHKQAAEYLIETSLGQ